MIYKISKNKTSTIFAGNSFFENTKEGMIVSCQTAKQYSGRKKKNTTKQVQEFFCSPIKAKFSTCFGMNVLCQYGDWIKTMRRAIIDKILI